MFIRIFQAYILGLIFLIPVYFHLDWFIISIIIGWILAGITNGVLIHRKYSHNLFVYKNKFFEFVSYTILILTGQGSPINWAYGHRVHHRYPDQKTDPQSPHTIGKFRTFFSLFPTKVIAWDGIINDLLTDHRLVMFHRLYIPLLISWNIVCGLINFELLIYVVAIPTFITTIMLGYVNTFAHSDKDNIKNLKGSILLWGEGYHATHHNDPKLARQGANDLSWHVINFIGIIDDSNKN